MNILYILSGTPMEGGATKSFLTMMQAVINAGHNVAVVCPDSEGAAQYLKDRNIQTLIVPYRFGAWPFLRNAKDACLLLPRLLHNYYINKNAHKVINRYAQDFKADLIHDNTSVTDSGYYAAKRLGIPHVTHIREYGDKDFHIHCFNLKKRLTAPDSYKIAITRDIADYRGLSNDPKAEVIYNGIIKESQINYNPDKKPYFFYAGRIESAKGVDDLIEAYINYAKNAPDSQPLGLKLAGYELYPDFMMQLKRRVIEAGVEHLVEYLGQLEVITPYTSEAAAVIIPSRFEGFGRVMPEAMARGALCIGRNTGGTAEQFNNGLQLTGSEIGLRFNNTEQLIKHLIYVDNQYKNKAFSNPDSDLYKMIHSGMATVEELYSIETYGNKILKFYDRIFQNSK